MYTIRAAAALVVAAFLSLLTAAGSAAQTTAQPPSDNRSAAVLLAVPVGDLADDLRRAEVRVHRAGPRGDAAATAAQSGSAAVQPANPPARAGAAKAAIVVRWALAQRGKPYRFGTAGPRSFDCSGLTMAAYLQVGIRLPHQSGKQRHAGQAVTRAQLQPADLVAWRGHVAIYIGNGQIIAATTPKGGVKRQPIWGKPIAYRRII